MKAKLILLMSLICLLASSTVFACCGRNYYYPTNTTCPSCASASCDPVEGPCQCTDPHCGLNDCLSDKECCEAFGNVGGR